MTENILKNPDWWPHRYDSIHDNIHFIKATRADHKAAVFLTDEYLAGAQKPHPVKRQTVTSTATQAPLHFIFHSGYCCSTLLCRAFDISGTSMSFKEPVILNDIVGWKARGANKAAVRDVLSDVLTVLAQPFETGETLIAKPSSLVNVIAPAIMQQNQNTKALLLYAPLKDFLGSIARKGMWGRLWVRELMSKQLRDGMINLGLEGEDYIRLTDLQAAAVCWLAQQSLFATLYESLGASRVMTLDCSVLLKSPGTIMGKLSEHFNLNLNDEQLNTIVTGPAFTSHSKTSVNFDAGSRESDKIIGEKTHAEEIDKVYAWAEIVANNAHIPLTLS